MQCLKEKKDISSQVRRKKYANDKCDIKNLNTFLLKTLSINLS